ncbi:MAG: glycogen synthase [Euryarchaeota archaeon]|nr:glycogen synthase [Euryarchaeota archaeon]
MNVLFATVEMYPLAKIGGLGDVAGSLPKNIRKLGVDIRVVMPYHRFIEADSEHIGNMKIEQEVYEIHHTTVDEVPVYLIKNEFLCKDKVYGYQDAMRWAKFSRVVATLPEFLNWDVDLIHMNDWMTALVPAYSIKGNVKFLLTIHNLKHQGKIELEQFTGLSLPENRKNELIWQGKINYLKGGIMLSDAVSTVSPTYAKEITTEEFGEGLHEILKKHRDKLYGIINGIDYEIWNPETDENIFANYSKDNLSGKDKNREAMKDELGIDDDKPLIGFVARLVEQKGLDIMLPVLKEINDAHIIILGTGREKYEKALKNMEGKYVHPIIKYDEKLAHQIYAATDMFLMPSRFEPCGLGQMIALRYGSIPIVRKTGGLADTVKDVSEEGWGFVFEEYRSEALRKALKRALEYYNKDAWDNLVHRAMKQDFSWKNSSKKYVELYKRIL